MNETRGQMQDRQRELKALERIAAAQERIADALEGINELMPALVPGGLEPLTEEKVRGMIAHPEDHDIHGGAGG